MDTKTATPTYVAEIVWDGGASGTGLSVNGQALSVGSGGAWGPEQLLLLAAEGSYMRSFLEAARDAHLQVLGYVSSGHLDVPDEGPSGPQITLRPCVVVGSIDDVPRAATLSKGAVSRSLAGRLLGEQFRVSVDVQLEIPS